ncbi:MAG: type I-E CRISPR-associated protein Cas6/Cse3/CasE, partial [Bacillota bacterium]
NPTVPDVLVTTRQRVSYSHGWHPGRGEPGAHRRSPLTFAAVEFEGHLTVLDPERFRETLRRGVGPGKAYGFGLLSIAPAGR